MSTFFLALGKNLQHCIECAKAFYAKRAKFPTSKNYLTSLILRMFRLLDCALANNPMAFVPYLEPFLGIAFINPNIYKDLDLNLREFRANSFQLQDDFRERYYIQIITFMADILSTAEYCLIADIA